MASEERPSSDPVIDPQQVAALGPRMRFLLAVELLERLNAGSPRVGGLGPAAEESIRFRHDPAMTFSAGDISKIEVKKKRLDPTNELSPTHNVYEVTTTFLGLTGATTPLPLYFAEEIAQEDPDAAIRRDFLDIFHHRFIALLYRLQAKYRYANEFESNAADAWSNRILALSGIDLHDAAATSRLPRWRLLRLAPLLANRSRTKHTLEVALEDVLEDVLEGARVKVEQFVGRWVDIEERQRIKLGQRNSNLGTNCVMGVKIFDRGGKIRLVIGPLSGTAFRRFLPDGDQVQTVRSVVGLFSRDPIEFDMELVLAKDATPRLRLSMTDGSKLGLDSWLGGREDVETRVVVDVPFDDDVPAAAADSPPTTAMTTRQMRRPVHAVRRRLARKPQFNQSVELNGRRGSIFWASSSGEGHHAR